MKAMASYPQQHQLKTHFGLTRLPFRKNLPATQMFDSKSQTELHKGLWMWTEVKGFALVCGPPGVGKSITLRRFLADLDEARFHVLRFSSMPTTVIGFLRSLSRLLDLPMRLHAADMFDAAKKQLTQYQEEQGPHPLLVLDDAEGLHIDTLDLLRRLTAYDLDAADRFSILLAGTEHMLEILSHPRLSSLRSRIAYVQTLRSFSLQDTRQYVDYQLKLADAEKELFAPDAVHKLFMASKGKPRAINQLALQALIAAAIQGEEVVSPAFMRDTIRNHPLFSNDLDIQE